MDSTSPNDGQLPSRYRSVRQQHTSNPPPQETATDGVHRSRSRYHHTRPANGPHDVASPVQSPDAEQRDTVVTPPSRDIASRDRSIDAIRGRQDVLPGQVFEPVITSPTAEEERKRRTDSPNVKAKVSKQDVRFDQAPQTIHARKEGAIGPQDEVISGDESDNVGCFAGFFKRKRVDPIKNTSEKAAPARVHTPKANEAQTIRPGGGGVVPNTDAPISAVNAGDRRVLVECGKSSMLLPVTPETTAVDLIISASNVFSEPIDVRSSVLLEHFGTVGVQRPLRRYEHVRDVMNSWDDDRANTFHLIPARAAEVNPAGLSASNVSREKPAQSAFLMHYSQKPGHWDKRLITVRQDGQIVMSKPNKDDETIVCHLSDFDIYTPTAAAMNKKIKPPKKFCYAIKSQQKTSMFLSTATYVHFLCAGDRTHGASFYDVVQGWRSWYLVNVMGEGQKKAKETSLQHSQSIRGGNAANLHRSASKRGGNAPNLQHSPSKRGGNAPNLQYSPSKRAANATSHSNNDSIGSHYQLGTFKPLDLDMSQFERPSSSRSSNGKAMNQVPSRKLSTRERDQNRIRSQVRYGDYMTSPVLADDEPLVNLAANRDPNDAPPSQNEVFSDTGLLGRSYSTRRQEQQQHGNQAEQPFTGGGLIEGAGEVGVARKMSIKRTNSKKINNPGPSPARRPSTRDGRARRDDTVDLARSGSTRTKAAPANKPLVDLTPQYQPPPQHVKKGKGYKPRPEELGEDGVLIDAATSGEKSWRDELPETKDWRGRANQANQSPAGSATAGASEMNQGRARSRSRSAKQAQAGEERQEGSRYASPAGIERPGSSGGPKNTRTRREFSGASGVSATSSTSDAGVERPAPLLDIAGPRKFAKGSLLDKIAKFEQNGPGPRPVIPRQVS